MAIPMISSEYPLPVAVAKVDKGGPAYKKSHVIEAIVTDLSSDASTHVSRHAKKHVSPDIDKASKIVEDSIKMFTASHDHMMQSMEEISTSAKKASGRVRAAAEDLSSGLSKIQKQANFNNLEKYVNLLERAAQAMSILSELEKTGKLDKISAALK